MQDDINELVSNKLDEEMALLLICIDLRYKQLLTHEGGLLVIYADLLKVLYSTVNTLLFLWKDLYAFLIRKGLRPICMISASQIILLNANSAL